MNYLDLTIGLILGLLAFITSLYLLSSAYEMGFLDGQKTAWQMYLAWLESKKKKSEDRLHDRPKP